uniref:Protein spinster n=1 Tax=Noccaea caerulescens TaxID=107243 RepID=A0A1J3K0N1_NOCCA
MGRARTSSGLISVAFGSLRSLFPRNARTNSMKRKTGKFLGVSISLILINLAAIMERADENLLPSVYKEVSEAFNAGPSDLGYLSFARNFVRGLASPLAGVLVITYDRPVVLAIGTFCWALSTAAVGASKYFIQVALWRAVNGFGLAIVIPALQSFIADSYKDGARGAGFGLFNLIGTIGGIGGGVVATVMAGSDFWGIPGWRCAFIMMATLSAVIGLLVLLFVVDPRKNIDREEVMVHKTNSSSVWNESWTAIKAVVKVRTFQVIILQGIVGSLPWTAMVFFTMWFELIGFDHNQTAALLGVFATGGAIGTLTGGIIADKMSRVFPNSGRVMCAQFSAFMGIPFSIILLKAIPQSTESYSFFSVTLFFMGLTITWCGSAVNAPMFAEVVPPKHRTMIYAFDRAIEGSFSSVAAPLVGILSEKMFGYDSKGIDPLKGSSVREADALSKGLLSMMAVPFGLCCLCYTPLHFVYQKDRENAKIATSKVTEMI